MQRSESFAVCLYVYQGAFYANYFLITQTFSMACIIVNRSKKNQPVSRPPVVRNTALQREGFRGFPDIEFGRFILCFSGGFSPSFLILLSFSHEAGRTMELVVHFMILAGSYGLTLIPVI